MHAKINSVHLTLRLDMLPCKCQLEVPFVELVAQITLEGVHVLGVQWVQCAVKAFEMNKYCLVLHKIVRKQDVPVCNLPEMCIQVCFVNLAKQPVFVLSSIIVD